MKRMLLASLLSGLAFAATAQQPPSVPAPESHDLKTANAKADAMDRFCLQETGSLIVKAHNRHIQSDADKQCASVPGHSWSGRDLRRTGLETADALRLLDPSIH